MLGKLNEIYFSSTTKPRESEGKVVKGIMRTGSWDVTPTAAGRLDKPLKIVKSGKSDDASNTISLQHLVDNFGGPIKKVQIPLSDDMDDEHVQTPGKNMTKFNTGFINKIWIEDDEDDPETSHLMAEFDFTEEDVKAKALRGTFSDVSSGIVNVQKDGTDYGTTLHHVCITNSPFMDNLKPYVMASDAVTLEDTDEVMKFKTSDSAEDQTAVQVVAPAPPAHTMSYKKIMEAAQTALSRDLNLGEDYKVTDASVESVIVENDESSWKILFTVEDDDIIRLPFRDKWEAIVDVPPSAEVEQEEVNRETAQTPPVVDNNVTKEGSNMPKFDLEKIPEDQRDAVAELLQEAEDAKLKQREAEVDSRVEELKKNFSDSPGFLKLYRKVALGKVEGEKVIVFSDNGKSKIELSPVEVLDQAIEAFEKIETVNFSDQHQRSGSDVKPPEGGDKTDEERFAEAKAFFQNAA